MSAIALNIRVADNFFTRLRGLLFSSPLPPSTGLLIRPCSSVHTAFMGYAIDVIFIDQRGTIVKIVPQLKPWRAAMCSSASQTLELLAGEAARIGLQEGMSLAEQYPQLLH